MKSAHHSFLTAGAIVAAITVGSAQQRGPQPQPPPAPRATQASAGMPATSAEFVARVAEAGAAELAAAKLAMAQASSADTKAFAAQMAKDHEALKTELASLAQDRSLTLPGVAAAETRAVAKLNGVTGAVFDHEYLSEQVVAHENAVRLFEHEAQQGSDAKIKAFAQKHLPTLRNHLKMAKETVEKTEPKSKY